MRNKKVLHQPSPSLALPSLFEIKPSHINVQDSLIDLPLLSNNYRGA